MAKAKVSNAMVLAKSLSIERRWIVSGSESAIAPRVDNLTTAPTAHLQQGGELEVREAVDAQSPKTTKIMPQSTLPRSRVWSSHDKDDAARMGIMIGGFLAAQPFRSETEFREHVYKPLCHPGGPQFGATERLRYIMSELMVKHAYVLSSVPAFTAELRPKVIDEEASLPPSTFMVERLRFHPFQRLTYNVLTALIASNVYTSKIFLCKPY